MYRSRKIQLVLLICGLAALVSGCSSANSRKLSRRSSVSVQANKIPDLWLSKTTGNEYFVRMNKTHFYAQWVNLPPAAAQHNAYIHTVCKHVGSKWVGTTDVYMPCAIVGKKTEKVVNTCHLKMKIEIDSISKNRITGRGQTLKKFNCHVCKVIETGWANFDWVPVR